MLHEVATVLIISLCICAEIATSLGDGCKKCEPRTFEESDGCACDDKEFCNEDSEECEKCGDCFDHWNDAIEDTRGDIYVNLKRVIEHYGVDLDHLRALLRELPEKIEELDGASGNIDSLIGRVDEYISEIRNRLKQLQDALERIKRALNSQGESPTDIDEVMKALKELRDRVDELGEAWVDDSDPELKKKLQQLKKNYEDMIKQMSKYDFPVAASPDSLNLALSLESDLDLLEAVISEYKAIDADQHIKPYHESVAAIDKDVELLKLHLLQVVNDSLNVFDHVDDVKELEKNADEVSLSAQDVESKLKHLLDEEKRFYDLYEILKEILGQKLKLDKLTEAIMKLKPSMELSDDELEKLEKEFSRELEEYKAEQGKLPGKFARLEGNRADYDKLLSDLLIVKEEAEQLEEPKSVDELNQDIDDMGDEIDKYTAKILEYCRETRRDLTTAP